MMHKAFNYLLISILYLITSFSLWAVTLTPEQQQAKEEGIRLYQQSYINYLTEEKLMIAAEAGDIESMVYLGIVMRITTDLNANKWLQKAAEAGDIYAMYQLTQSMPAWNIVPQLESKNKPLWQVKGEALALERAKAGDPESMYIYYRFTGDISWLEKAAHLGWPDAQAMLASAIDQGTKPYHRLSQKIRLALATKWWILAADNGQPVAAHILYYYVFEDEPAIGKTYLLKAVEQSYIKAVDSYINLLIDNPLATSDDLIKAYALASFYQDIKDDDQYNPGASIMEILSQGHRLYPHISPLTAEQIEQAMVFKALWVETHPRLTNYFSKLKIVGDMHSY